MNETTYRYPPEADELAARRYAEVWGEPPAQPAPAPAASLPLPWAVLWAVVAAAAVVRALREGGRR